MRVFISGGQEFIEHPFDEYKVPLKSRSKNVLLRVRSDGNATLVQHTL